MSRHWPLISEWLERVKARLGDDGRDVRKQVETGHATCWLIWLDESPAGLVVLERYAGESAGIAITAGERLDEWEAPVMALCKAWARDQGARVLEVRGRRGWLRRLAKYGFKWAGDCLSVEV